MWWVFREELYTLYNLSTGQVNCWYRSGWEGVRASSSLSSGWTVYSRGWRRGTVWLPAVGHGSLRLSQWIRTSTRPLCRSVSALCLASYRIGLSDAGFRLRVSSLYDFSISILRKLFITNSSVSSSGNITFIVVIDIIIIITLFAKRTQRNKQWIGQ